MESSTKIWIALAIICFVIAIAVPETQKTNKSYHSDIYSSWEEERIDELECDVAYLMDKFEKKRY